MPLVIPADPEKVVVDFIHDLIPTLPDLNGWTVSTVIPAGVTPVKRIAVRSIGGSDEQVVADRPRVDIRVWGDGTEANRSRIARLLLAHLRRQFRCRVFASPVPLSDPADNTKMLTLFTVELLLRGTQS